MQSSISALKLWRFSVKIRDIEIPGAFICPITQKVMQDPVVAADGMIYERAAIELWLETKNYNVFGVTLENKTVQLNNPLKATMAGFAKLHNLTKEFSDVLDKDELTLKIRKMQHAIEAKKIIEAEEALKKKKEKAGLSSTNNGTPDYYENKRKAVSSPPLPEDLMDTAETDDKHKKRKLENEQQKEKEEEMDSDVTIIEPFARPKPKGPLDLLVQAAVQDERAARRRKAQLTSRPIANEPEGNKIKQEQTVKENLEDQFSFETKGEGDCAFHATFGLLKDGQYVCDDVVEKRKQMAKAIREAKKDNPIYPLIERAIEAILMSGVGGSNKKLVELKKSYVRYSKKHKKNYEESWNMFESALKEHKEINEFIEMHTKDKKGLSSYERRFQHCLTIEQGILYGLIKSVDSLQTAFELYNEKTAHDFIIKNIDEAVQNAYADYVQCPRQWLLPMELNIIAYVFNVNIKYHIRDPKKKVTFANDDFNKNGKPSVGVVFDGRGHYERVNENYFLKYKNIKKETFATKSPSSTPKITASISNPVVTISLEERPLGSNALSVKEGAPSTVALPAEKAKKKKKKKKHESTFSEYLQDATNGSVVHQFNLAMAYYWGGSSIYHSYKKDDQKIIKEVQQNYIEAYRWFSEVIEKYKNDGDALNCLGQIEFAGLGGFPVNKQEGFKKLETAAALGEPHAQCFLGELHLHGEEPIKKNEAKAFELLEKAANKGNTDAQIHLAEMFATGIYVAIDEDKTLEWFTKAAQNKDPRAFNQLGLLYRDGMGKIKVDEKRACEWFEISSKSGDAGGLFYLGYMLEKGLGVPKKDEKQAFNKYLEAAKMGHVEAQMNLAAMYAFGNAALSKDEAQASHWYMQAADKGNAEAQNLVGNRLSEGLGIEKNDKKACEYYDRAAAQGNVDAMVALGEMHQSGRGVVRNVKIAFDWFQKASNHVAALVYLAEMYRNGNEFLSKNIKIALELYTKAANQEDPDAEFALAEIYSTDHGGEFPKNNKLAYEWYTKAAKHQHLGALYKLGDAHFFKKLGLSENRDEARKTWQIAADKNHAKSQFMLGFMFKRGLGVKQSDEIAKSWWEKAAKQGDPEVNKQLEKMNKPAKSMLPLFQQKLKEKEKIEAELLAMSQELQQPSPPSIVGTGSGSAMSL